MAIGRTEWSSRCLQGGPDQCPLSHVIGTLGEILPHHSELCFFAQPQDVLCAGGMHLKAQFDPKKLKSEGQNQLSSLTIMISILVMKSQVTQSKNNL